MLKLAVVCSCCHGWTRFGVFLSCLPATSRANTSQAVVNEGAGGAGRSCPANSERRRVDLGSQRSEGRRRRFASRTTRGDSEGRRDLSRELFCKEVFARFRLAMVDVEGFKC
jgi:hypothetical protein